MLLSVPVAVVPTWLVLSPVPTIPKCPGCGPVGRRAVIVNSLLLMTLMLLVRNILCWVGLQVSRCGPGVVPLIAVRNGRCIPK